MILLLGHFVSCLSNNKNAWLALPYRIDWPALVLPWLPDLITLNFSL
jgi:hypothetical protein